MNETPPPALPEPRDGHAYGILRLSKETLTHFLRAAEYYKGLLHRSQTKLQAHSELLAALLDEEDLQKQPLNEGMEVVDRVIGWLQKRIKECGEDSWGSVHIRNLSHGDVRYFKSISRLYEAHLLEQRNRLAADPEMPESTVATVDRRLAELREKTETGVFANASAFPLLVAHLPKAPAPHPSKSVDEPSAAQMRVAPEIIHGLQLLDGELRARCGDLFQMFAEKNLEERYDTVIREIGVLVEDRLRRACRAPKAKHGVDLAAFAFGGETPRLLLSRVTAEQEGVHHLFRGFFGWIRNPAGHRLLGKLSKERALQLLALADYLLGLVGEAGESYAPESKSGETPAGESETAGGG